MTAQKESIKTPYGETTIETYDCDSCGNTVAYEDTVEFTIGDTEGRACEHCEENGPISFPRRVLEWEYPKNTNSKEDDGLIIHIVLAALFLPFLTIAGLTDKGSQFEKGYATAVLTFVTYLGIILLLLV